MSCINIVIMMFFLFLFCAVSMSSSPTWKAPLLSKTQESLERIRYYCSVRHQNNATSEICNEKGSIRIFLSAFMISLHHGCVFLFPYDEVQRDLISLSARLVERLESVALSLLEHQTFNCVPFELTRDFLPLLANFISHSWAWNIPDKARLERSIQEELVK